ncbi:MAG TPA: hypothetical protein PLT82_02660 [Candidatus Hydrogenedens sp.]|nr:hypothetical protein [Candidatus Hydrogenedens sp.]HOK09027.1 hypothetical protein [Candidatus Hydrogenedens sp.]HOL19362.1 hypothetical protein [Candidatus Hydrogenedens sp.]HPP58014.1 hypothetical protein [Candidatus Hydrogenedens sp.]
MQRVKQIFRFLLVLVMVCCFAYGYFKYRDLSNRYQEVKKAEAEFQQFIQQIRDLAEQKRQLEQEIERLKADQLKQEEYVRKNKGWVYPGEKVLRLEEQ